MAFAIRDFVYETRSYIDGNTLFAFTPIYDNVRYQVKTGDAFLYLGFCRKRFCHDFLWIREGIKFDNVQSLGFLLTNIELRDGAHE